MKSSCSQVCVFFLFFYTLLFCPDIYCNLFFSRWSHQTLLAEKRQRKMVWLAVLRPAFGASTLIHQTSCLERGRVSLLWLRGHGRPRKQETLSMHKQESTSSGARQSIEGSRQNL